MQHNIQFLIAILASNIIFLPVFFVGIHYKIKDKKIEQKSISLKKQVNLFVLGEYFVCLASVTIIPLPFAKAGSPYLNLDFFHQTYNNFLSAWNHTSPRTVWNETENLIGNIVLFFPMGILLPSLNLKFNNFFNVLKISFLCSFSIEASQYLISIKWGYNRVADVDDLFLNVLGALVGFLFYKIFIIAFKSRFL